MAALKVVAIKPGYRQKTASFVKIGSVFDVDDSKIAKNPDGSPKLNKDGTLLKQKWLKPVKSEAEGARIAQEAKTAEDNKGKEAALAASGGKASKDKMQKLGEELAG